MTTPHDRRDVNSKFMMTLGWLLAKHILWDVLSINIIGIDQERIVPTHHRKWGTFLVLVEAQKLLENYP